MQLFDGYIKRKINSNYVLLANGSHKSLGDFIGSLQYDSENKKLQYKSCTANSWSDLLTFGDRAFDSTAYLPKSGGAMNAGAIINWTDWGLWGKTNATYPKAQGGLKWAGTSDWILLSAEEVASDDLRLILAFGDDTSPSLDIRNNSGTTTARLFSSGQISAKSFVNTDSSDSYALLGGGSTKALSDFFYKSGGTLEGPVYIKLNNTATNYKLAFTVDGEGGNITIYSPDSYKMTKATSTIRYYLIDAYNGNLRIYTETDGSSWASLNTSGSLSTSAQGTLWGASNLNPNNYKLKSSTWIPMIRVTNDTNFRTYLDGSNVNLHNLANEELNLFRFYSNDYANKNLPCVDSWNMVFSLDGAKSWFRILALDPRTDDVFVGRKSNNSWAAWLKFLTTANWSSYCAAASHTHPLSQITRGTAAEAYSDWNYIFLNTNGGSLKSAFYLTHGGGYGAHLRGYSTSASVYMLEIYNDTRQLFAIYGDGHSVFSGNISTGTYSITTGGVSASGTSNRLIFRHLDGQNCNGDYNLYLQYHQSNAVTYFNGGTYYIKGGQYNGNAATATNADAVDGQHFKWSNDSNSPTYLWAANSSGTAFLCARGSMSVNYANGAGNVGGLAAKKFGIGATNADNVNHYYLVASFTSTGLYSSWSIKFHIMCRTEGGEAQDYYVLIGGEYGSATSTLNGVTAYTLDNYLISGDHWYYNTSNGVTNIYFYLRETWKNYTCTLVDYSNGSFTTSNVKLSSTPAGLVAFSHRTNITSANIGSYTAGAANSVAWSNVSMTNRDVTLTNSAGRALVHISNSYAIFGYNNCDGGLSTYVDGRQIYFRIGSNWTTALTLDSGGNATFAHSVYSNSDIRLKKDINIINSSELLLLFNASNLLLKQFTWKSNNLKSYGFIALELELYIPEAIIEGKGGVKSVSYNIAFSKIIASIINKINDIDKKYNNEQVNIKVKMLENKVKELENKIKILETKLGLTNG